MTITYTGIDRYNKVQNTLEKFLYFDSHCCTCIAGTICGC